MLDIAFNGLSDLVQLHLNNNQIPSIETNMFSGLLKLEQLYLDNNQLTVLIINDAFKALINFNTL